MSQLQPVLLALRRIGTIVLLNEGLLIHTTALNEARSKLCEHLAVAKEVSVASFRDLLGSNRRCTLALLMQFDEEGITERCGDVRIRA